MAGPSTPSSARGVKADAGLVSRLITLWTGGVNAPGVFLVHVNIVVYACAYWLATPMLPFLLKEHGASNLNFGMFQSLFAVVQLGGGLTVGFLQDRTSSSTALSLTQIGSSLVYLLVFSAGSLEVLYLSRLPTVLQQAMQVAQAYISKASAESNRAVAFSRVTVSYAIGMMVGSTSSGFIADQFGTRSVMLLAFALSILMVVVNALFLPPSPATLPAAAREKSAAHAASSSTTADASITGYFSMVKALPRLFLFFAMVFITRSVYEPVFTLQLMNYYGVQQGQMGTFMSMGAVVGMISNVVLLPALLKVASESRVQAGAIVVGSAVYAIIALVPMTLNVYIGSTLVMAAAASLLYTTAAAYLTARVPTQIHGQAIASTHALRSAVGIVGPLAGTALLDTAGASTAAAVNAVLLGLSLVFM